MNYTFYLGTYTKRSSQGVYAVELNTQTKKLENVRLVAALDNPTYLTVADANDTMIAVTKENGRGGVTVLKKEGDVFQPVSDFHDANNPPCYVAFNSSSRQVLSSNYHGGEVSLYTLDAHHHIQFVDRDEHVGSSVHPNQDKAHVHYSHWTPDNRFAVVCDLGTDEVMLYTTVHNTLDRVFTYHTAKGAGPRHVVFHPTLEVAYIICELNATIEVVDYDSQNGTLHQKQVISLLDNPAEQTCWGGAVRILSNGSFLYATNRGYDVLTSFKVQPDGTLHLVQSVPTQGSVARDFNFDPSEQFILVAHQESDNLSLFERHEDGTVTLLHSDTLAPEAVCVIPVI